MVRSLKSTFIAFVALALLPTLCLSQTFPFSPKLGAQGVQSPHPPSNSVSHMSVRGNTLWIGTGKGLARSANGGRSWESFRAVSQFANPGIFSIDVQGDTIWTSTGFNQDINDQSIQTGSGYTYSTDNGTTWNHLPQTLDGQGDSVVSYGINTIKFLPVTVPQQNVTYDVEVAGSTVWITSWASGLRKSTDLGQTWQRVVLPSQALNSISPNDTLVNYRINPVPSPGGDNFKAFSVFAQTDSIIWYGSAGGINKSTDAGLSWTKFTSLNQQAHILGDWVIAIKGQQLDTIRADSIRLWCTNWIGSTDFDPTQQYGVSYTEDGGRIWKNFLHGVKAYDFAFKGPIAYVATEEGVFRTSDGGRSWYQSGTIIDQTTGQRITSISFFTVAVIGDTVYCGSDDGIVKTIDNDTHPFGESWQVVRAYQPLGASASTYAYPNPFSPLQEVARFHYSTAGAPASVTIEVFDFAMNRVRTIVKDAQRSGTTEYDEIWNGRDDGGNEVTNGVYFYRVVLNSGDPVWGKVMLLQ